MPNVIQAYLVVYNLALSFGTDLFKNINNNKLVLIQDLKRTFVKKSDSENYYLNLTV